MFYGNLCFYFGGFPMNEQNGYKYIKTLAVCAVMLAVAAFLISGTLCYVFGLLAITFAIIAKTRGYIGKMPVVAIVFACVALVLQLLFDLFFESLLGKAFEMLLSQLGW